MPKVNDIKKYWEEIAGKAGLDPEKAKQVKELLGDEAFSKAFSENFKPLPDYSHDLDTVRQKTREEKDQEYDDWFKKEQLKYNEYIKAEERLKAYETKFGKLDQTTKNDMTNQSGLTREEFDRLLEERLNDTMSRRDSAYMDLLEIRESHLGTFKKPLDVKTFEKEWKDHPEWGNSMKSAYRFYTEPEMEKIRQTEFDTKLQQRYEEGLRDGHSRRGLPLDNASKTFSPMFDRKEDVAKLSTSEQERHSREAFFEGLRDGSKSA